MQASDGKLYGMTPFGGSSNAGVMFSFDPPSFTYQKLKDLDSTNGEYLSGSLMQAIDRRLYGTARLGGSNNLGIIFSYDPKTSTYTKLKDYEGFNGVSPGYGSAFIDLALCTWNGSVISKICLKMREILSEITCCSFILI